MFVKAAKPMYGMTCMATFPYNLNLD